jgi:diacylglycerol kinase (ATP)
MKEDTIEKQGIALRPRTSAVIIANPMSGSFPYHTHHLDQALAYLRRRGWQADLWYTQAPEDARRLAHQAVAEGADIVVASGGDGTINEIIQELAGTETALGVLPNGTVNVWAREIGLPLDDLSACDVLLHGRTRRIDLGRINNRYFLLMAGIGIDGEVTRAIEHKPVKRLGVLGYLLVGTLLGLGFPNFQATLNIDGKEIKANAFQIVIGNTQLWGGALQFTWQAKCDDGLLDVCVVRKSSLPGRLVVALDFLLRRERRRQRISYYTCTSIEVRTRQPIPIQVDGEIGGFTPATFTVAPGALKVIVPQTTPEELFSQE